MSITVPSTQLFYSFWGDEADDQDVDRATIFLNLAADLLWLGTGLDTDPTDARLSQLVQYAICDMAIYLYVTRDDIDAVYSPFQSERVGSYSYSKSYVQATKAVSKGESTGVPLFDMLVSYLTDQAITAAGGLLTSEWVFKKGLPPLFIDSLGVDPTFWGTRSAWYAANRDYREYTL